MDYGGNKVMQEFWDIFAGFDPIGQCLIIGFFVALVIWVIAAIRLDISKYNLDKIERHKH